jgi:hypothetical protein
MSEHWLLFRLRLGQWMLHKAMDVIPRCDLRDTLRFAIVSAYAYERDMTDQEP